MAIDAHNFAKADTSANLDYYSTAEGLAEAKVCSHVLPVLVLVVAFVAVCCPRHGWGT